MDVQIVLAYSNAGDYFAHVFRSFPHGLFGFVPSIHSGPERRLGRRVRFASQRINDIRGCSSVPPERADGHRLRAGFR